MKLALRPRANTAFLCFLILSVTPGVLWSQTDGPPVTGGQEELDNAGQQRQQLVQDLKEQIVGIVADRVFEMRGPGESEREQENHAMIVVALQEAIDTEAGDHAAQLLLALFRDDPAAMERAAQAWHAATPTTFEASCILFILHDKQITRDGENEAANPALPHSGRATEDEWSSLLTAIAQPDAVMSEFVCSSCIGYFVDRNDFEGALRFLTEFARRPGADALDLFSNFHSLRRVQVRGSFNENQADECLIECSEQIIAAAIRCKAQVSELTRTDIFGYLMSEYTRFLRNTRQYDRGLVFLNGQTRQIGLMQYEPGDAAAFTEMIEGSILILLANADRAAASEMALERLEERLQSFDDDEITIDELAAAFEVAFLLADSTGLESVYARFDSYQFLSDETIVKHIVGKPDADQDLESNRQAINGAWNACFSRFVSDGRTAASAPNWSRLLSIDGKIIQLADEELHWGLGNEPYGRIIRADLRFNNFISQFAVKNPGKPLLTEFSIESETWFGHQPVSAGDLSGKVVVLVLLTADGFCGSDGTFFEEITNSISGKNESPGELFVLFDDDLNEDQFANIDQIVTDEWLPEGQWSDTAAVKERMGIPESIDVPLIYAYKNKFIDALIPKTEFEYFDFHRTLIFDGQGMLRRVVCPGHEKFESIADTVDRLALENENGFKSESNDD